MFFGQRNQFIESSPRHNLDCPTRRERMSISFHNGTILTRRPNRAISTITAAELFYLDYLIKAALGEPPLKTEDFLDQKTAP